jgi:hypothetical protein
MRVSAETLGGVHGVRCANAKSIAAHTAATRARLHCSGVALGLSG